MISLFYRDVEHGSWQGLDGVGGGEGGDCGRSPARRGPAIRRLKKIQIYCYRKRTPKVLYICPKIFFEVFEKIQFLENYETYFPKKRANHDAVRVILMQKDKGGKQII